MPFDAHKNFVYSTIATTPSPAVSGTSLVVTTGDGAIFPTPPFNCTVWPAIVLPLTTNAEIVRVTALSGDTLTIVRQQENSNARIIQVGDQISATITTKTLSDIETGRAPSITTLTNSATATIVMDSTKASQNARIVLVQNTTTLVLSGLVAGMAGILILKQDDIGNRTLTLPISSKVVSNGGGGVTLSVPASAIDILAWIYDGSNIFWNYGNTYSTTLHISAIDWSNRVVANGGVIPTAQTTRAVSDFFYYIDRNNLTPYIISCNLFAPDTLTACITPTMRGPSADPWTSANFVPADLNLEGLSGNGVNKWLNTGIVVASTYTSDISAGLCGVTDSTNSGSLTVIAGAGQNSSTRDFLLSRSIFDCWDNDPTHGRTNILTPPTQGGFLMGVRSASALATVYFGTPASSLTPIASSTSTSTGTHNEITVNPIGIFCINTAGGQFFFSNQRISFIGILSGLSQNQGQTLYNGVQLFRYAVNGGQVSIRNQPVDRTVGAGDCIKLKVAGENIAAYQWKKNGVALIDGGQITGSTTDTLKILSAAIGDAGSYKCLVTNGRQFVDTTTVSVSTVNDTNMMPVSGLLMKVESRDFDTRSNSSSIINWFDLTTNDHDWVIGTVAPTVSSSSVHGGRASVRFDSTMNFQQPFFFDASGYSGLEVYAVYKKDNDPSISGQETTDAGSVFIFNHPINFPHHQPWSDGNFYEGFARTDRPSIGNPTTSVSTAFIRYNIRVKADGTLYDAFINAENFGHFTSGYTFQQQGLETSNDSLYRLGMGVQYGGSNYFFRGNIAAIYVYNRVLSGPEKTQVEAHINEVFGV